MRWGIVVLLVVALAGARAQSEDSEDAAAEAQYCKRCGINEVCSNCYNDCQKTCKNRFQNDRACIQVCRGPGCVCQEGYLRHDNGTCVPEYQCSPPVCNNGEVYNQCGSSCPTSCENKDNTCLVCTLQCVPGCYCAKGTIRGPKNTCVKPENCPRPKCGPNEVFNRCPPTCPRTDECKELWSKIPCEPIDCCHPQCRCRSGYYRKNGVCVPSKECSS
ncbi:serine protease inhibitor swm-1-like [Leguminivora glycinivorella]|uniref:serine protease inhibitor swm-1-like n=1 Tax=Leguminivora glycinivorella TaxID=1035111 RepID=UPI00200FBA1A|nr:serine protease inhibitor swm-1-like [Leguminivora glycinivorella]